MYKYSLSFKRKFEAAHRFKDDSFCSNLHGHSWSIRWHFIFDERFPIIKDKSDTGKYFDFKELKEDFSKFLEKYFDHSVLLHKDDRLAKTLKGSRIVLYPSNPTTEIICFYFALLLWNSPFCQKYNVSLKVTLEETSVNTVELESDHEMSLLYVKQYKKWIKQFK